MNKKFPVPKLLSIWSLNWAKCLSVAWKDRKEGVVLHSDSDILNSCGCIIMHMSVCISTKRIFQTAPSNYFNIHDWFLPIFLMWNLLYFSTVRKTKIVVIKCTFSLYHSRPHACAPIPHQVRIWGIHFAIWLTWRKVKS